MSKQRQENILQFIENYITEYRIAPSVREICEGLNIRSTSTVHRYLHQLEQEEKIHMDSGKKRAIFISDTQSQGIPIIEQVHPEFTLLDEQNIQEYYHPISEQKKIFTFIRLLSERKSSGIRIFRKEIFSLQKEIPSGRKRK